MVLRQNQEPDHYPHPLSSIFSFHKNDNSFDRTPQKAVLEVIKQNMGLLHCFANLRHRVSCDRSDLPHDSRHIQVPCFESHKYWIKFDWYWYRIPWWMRKSKKLQYYFTIKTEMQASRLSKACNAMGTPWASYTKPTGVIRITPNRWPTSLSAGPSSSS